MAVDARSGRVGERPRGRWLRILGVGLVAAALASAGYAYRCHRLLRNAAEAAREGRPDEARALLLTASRAYLGQGRALSGLAGLAAIEGDGSAAREHMAAARLHARRGTPLPPDRVLSACFARADYELARDLATFYWEAHRSDDVDFYLGASELALANVPAARAALSRVSPVSAHGDESNRLKERIKSLETDPRRPLLLDRKRRPLAIQKLGDVSGALELTQPALHELVGGAEGRGIVGGLSPEARRQTYVLTIDEELELLADAALGRYEGSLVVVDPRTGEILAFASHSPAASRSYQVGGVALPGHFEPGSVIKISTYLTAIDAGVELSDVFPLACTGWMPVDGKQLFDWTTHGTVSDMDHALAVSCNLAFARLGLAAGPGPIRETLRRFGFDRPPEPAVELGRMAPPGTGARALANLSIGLEELSATPLQLAVLAQAVANGGVARRPWVVKEVLDVLGRPVTQGKPAPLGQDDAASRVASPEAVARLIAGMRGVVEAPMGTGRRAKIDTLTLALKTGTAGDRAAGLDAIMVGFAPADDPVLAFGLMAGHAGKAEYEGARVVKAFLESALERGKFPGHEPLPKEATPGPAAPPAAAPTGP